MPTDGEGMEGRDASGALLRSSERRANRAEKILQLQELLDKWRTRAAMAHAENTSSSSHRQSVYLQCASELQEILNEKR